MLGKTVLGKTVLGKTVLGKTVQKPIAFRSDLRYDGASQVVWPMMLNIYLTQYSARTLSSEQGCCLPSLLRFNSIL